MKYADLRSGGVALAVALQHYQRASTAIVRGGDGAPPQTIEEVFVADALVALAARGGKTVLPIGNGSRTGGTMRSAINTVRHLNPARVVFTVLAGPAEAIAS